MGLCGGSAGLVRSKEKAIDGLTNRAGDATGTSVEGYSATAERLITRAGDIAVYVTVVLGYFFSLTSAHKLTLFNFTAFTALNLAYVLAAWLTWRLSRRVERSDVRLVAGMTIIALLNVAVGLMHATGIEFDWLLYFATVAMAIVVLPVRRGMAATLLLYAAVLCSAYLLAGWEGIGSWSLTMLSGFIFVAAFSYSNRLLTSERDRSARLLQEVAASNAELEQAHRQLQQYSSELEELTIARERTRMAREIHDTLGHYLTILSIQLETIGKLQERDPRQAIIEVAEARRVAAQSMQEVRNAVSALRPTGIATLSLPEALTQLGGDFRRVAEGAELTLDLDTDLPLPAISPDLQLALYRVAQEALTNVRKHAGAAKVLLRLRYENNMLELVVLDNGIGPVQAAPVQQAGGFGLIGLQERIELLGGRVAHGPAKPSGYRVEARVPVEPASRAAIADPAMVSRGGGKP